jgi:hypothetical protein
MRENSSENEGQQLLILGTIECVRHTFIIAQNTWDTAYNGQELRTVVREKFMSLLLF